MQEHSNLRVFTIIVLTNWAFRRVNAFSFYGLSPNTPATETVCYFKNRFRHLHFSYCVFAYS